MNVRELISRLERLDACTVADAMDALGHVGVVDGLSRRSTNNLIAGRVQTLKLGSKPPAVSSGQHLGTRTIGDAGDLDVIVVEQRTGIRCACWGGVLANAAQVRGIRGVIAEGPVRDVDEYEKLGFPVFSRSTTATTARGRIYEESCNETVIVGDINVNAGDLVIADASGVVFLPAQSAEEIIGKAEQIAQKEKRMTLELRNGKDATEVMGTDYESMLDA